MPRNKEKQRIYRKAYYHSHKEQEVMRKQTPEYQAKQRQYMRRRRNSLKEQLDKNFAKECYLCGENCCRLEMHEIHNCRHDGAGVGAKSYYLAHKEDFVRLCVNCHCLVSWLARKFGKTWQEIEVLLKGSGADLVHCGEDRKKGN